jgi:NodT family efflux transporter outer membrane factor (OMF) lipoprotein
MGAQSPVPARAFGALAALLALGGCAVGPDFHRPALPPEAGYGPAAANPAAPSSPRLAVGSDVPDDWWTVLGSPELDALVRSALEANPTLAAAKAAIRAAHEQVLAQRGAFFPTIGLSAQPSRQGVAEKLASPLASNSDLYSLTTSQVSVAYAPDLFGANRRAVEAAAANEAAQRFEFEAARLTLANSVAAAAIQDALLRGQIAATRTLIDDQTRTLASFRRQYELGQASQADVAAQEAALAQAEATIAPLEKQFGANRDLLAALVGKTPSQTPQASFDLQTLTAPAILPLSMPARLVEQRPDVRIAEAQLHAASAQIGIAQAARWPNLEIDAAAGSSSLGLAANFGRADSFWSLTGTLTQPVFAGGALRHRQRAAEAAYDQAAAQYQATVIGAFQNTADVLHALTADAAADESARRAEQAATRSFAIAQRQLALGDISQIAALGAEQGLAQARLAALQARAERLSDVVALFQALGGGWWNTPAGPRRPSLGGS